jgi:lysophospholipase L1-like esterase
LVWASSEPQQQHQMQKGQRLSAQCHSAYTSLFLLGVTLTSVVRCSGAPAGPDATTPVRIACVGDSITFGAHSTGGNSTYPGQLQILLDDAQGAGKYAVSNLGNSGKMMLKNSSAPYWKTKQYQQLVSQTWDVVVIMLGTNDAHNTCDAPSARPGCSSDWKTDCGGPNNTDASTNCRFADDFASMAAIVEALGTTPGVPPKVYVMTPPPLMQTNAGFPTMQTTINTLLPKLVPQMAKRTKGVEDVPINMFAAFGGVADWPSQFPDGCKLSSPWKPCAWWCDKQSCDQCHPNDVGYTHFAKAVYAGLGF